MPSLSELTEDAIIEFIQSGGAHGQDINSIVPRRFTQTKFDSGSALDPVTVPAIVVQARQIEQLHAQLAVWLFSAEITLYMMGDDTDTTAWDDMAMALETIFMVDDLKGYLSDAVNDYWCGGIKSRNMGEKLIDGRKWKRIYRLVLWASRAT